MTLFPRSSGILLHPTSLPGRFGIGDLGQNAYHFVDWLVDTGQSIWQVLPLGPTSYGDSPYQTLSAFAGNPYLISLDKLVEQGWLPASELADIPPFPADRVDYGWIIPYHIDKLRAAYKGFQSTSDERYEQFQQWCEANAYWLDDYALFITLKDMHSGKSWVEWEEEYITRDPEALAKASQEHADRINEHKFRQWVFFEQWLELKSYANSKGIRLFGDIPIFVAHDSADVWANQHEYTLYPDGKPEFIAGVPPDYFSPTGQRWGNPLYRWDVMAADGYQWWISRFRSILSIVDYIRIDHFRGFQDYWQIPAEEETAINGLWIPGPQHKFLDIIKEEFGNLPIIAEDLGDITPEVIELRDYYNLPGMKILQFAWSDPNNPFLPHQYIPNCVVYTGTHDNNTSLGWWKQEADENNKNFMRDYLGHEPIDINWTLIRMGMRSVAHTCILPLQDILGLDADARMNTPGVAQNNWTWRFRDEAFTHDGKDRLAHLTWLYKRRADQQ